MALGNMLTGEMGAAFAQALTVTGSRTKSGLLEGYLEGQKTKAAKAKKGLDIQKDIDKLKIDASNSLNPDKIDPKFMPEAVQNLINFNKKINEENLTAGTPELAYSKSVDAFVQFRANMNTTNARSSYVKQFRKGSLENNALVPKPINEFLSNDKYEYENDGFQSLPGFNIENNMAPDGFGGVYTKFPQKIEVDKYDIKELEGKDIAFYRTNGESVGKKQFKIEGTTFIKDNYRLSLDAIKKEVASSYDISPEYQSNIAYAYYQEKRTEPGFKENIEGLARQQGKVREELINYRANQIYNMGISKEDDESARAATKFDITVNTAETAAAVSEVVSPTMQFVRINQTQAEGGTKPTSIPALGYTIDAGERSLSITDGVIDQNTNQQLEASGSASFKASAIFILPVYSENAKNNRAYGVSGKAVDKGSITTELDNGNVTFETFVQARTNDELSGAGGKKIKGPNAFLPLSSYYSGTPALGTKMAISQHQQNLKVSAEMNAVRDMLNFKNPEALALYRKAIAEPANNSHMIDLIALANKEGYINDYMRGGKYIEPKDYKQTQGINQPVGGKGQVPLEQKGKPTGSPEKPAAAPKAAAPKAQPKESTTGAAPRKGKVRTAANSGKVMK